MQKTRGKAERISVDGEDIVLEKLLVEKARKGDHRAFTQLVRKLENTVYRYAYKLCRDQQRAEETLQDTFVNMYRKLNQFDGRAKLSTWLYSIATNSCLMKHRSARSREGIISYEELPLVREEVSSRGSSPHATLENKELKAALDNAIESLPVAYRLVFVMRDIEGLTAEETSRVLRISVEATKSRLRRARAALRETLHPFLTS
jgi:RNA polymerase sigma-70 factor (ECF subfamily)